jgi:alkylated DNA repair dioxygenase AlkB
MKQGELSLFAEEKNLKPNPKQHETLGFRVRPNYISVEEEQELLQHLSHGPWETDFKRRIQQYGLGYAGELGTNPEWVRDIPEFLRSLAARVQDDAPLERFPENCVVNEYVPPLGIAPHRDYPAYGPTVACVSLSSDILLDLVHPKRDRKLSIHIPSRSLWVMSGESRSKWLHGISPRLYDTINGAKVRRGTRVSITFRTAKNRQLVPQH